MSNKLFNYGLSITTHINILVLDDKYAVRSFKKVGKTTLLF